MYSQVPFEEGHQYQLEFSCFCYLYVCMLCTLCMAFTFLHSAPYFSARSAHLNTLCDFERNFHTVFSASVVPQDTAYAIHEFRLFSRNVRHFTKWRINKYSIINKYTISTKQILTDSVQQMEDVFRRLV